MKWNPWHGCHKLSPGCKNCYVYRIDAMHEKDASLIRKNASSFRDPIRRNRQGEYKYPAGTHFHTCFSSDFFLEEADDWRQEAWQIMRTRSNCHFSFITKRIDRFWQCIPTDWGEGYDNVSIAVTTENQQMADYRLPIYLQLPIRHKSIVCEPLLESIDLTPYLTQELQAVSAGGESGPGARICNYDWVLDIQRQCVDAGIAFHYHQTGANLLKDGKLYRIPRIRQHEQAKKAGLDFEPPKTV